MEVEGIDGDKGDSALCFTASSPRGSAQESNVVAWQTQWGATFHVQVLAGYSSQLWLG